MASADFHYCYRVTYKSEFYIDDTGQRLNFGWMTVRLKDRWPELRGIDHRLVCHDEEGRACSVSEGNINPIFATAAKECKGYNGSTYLVLDLTVVPRSTSLSSVTPGGGSVRERCASPTIADDGPKISRPPRYQYQIFRGDECFISAIHNEIDFSMDDIRKDIEDVWPELSQTNFPLRCRDASAKISSSRNELTTKSSSVDGLFDCFAKEVVRPNGDYILILELTVDPEKGGGKCCSCCGWPKSTSGEEESECQTAKDSNTDDESSEHDLASYHPEDVLSTSSAGLGTSSWVMPVEQHNQGSESSGIAGPYRSSSASPGTK
ncbi:hypothetical protein FOL47_003773 [Perkinsus chesapeaki]|uniref:Uncharacterized protein n=1 Tax=Perkinsus chesapeaki TaxID=330153 RepID=A0A7J6N0T0_PERCH|nr:hypothetical protein FOL47_003773 [Perkinsus chesapeaki]